MNEEAFVLIPARMASTRLPAKPLADIHGVPMIVHVWRRAMEARCGRVVVATDDERIKAAIEIHGGEAAMTRSDHPSGTDRLYEALTALDPDRRFQRIVNVQGDLPTLDPELVRTCLGVLDESPATDIATLAVEIRDETERHNPNVVKAVGTPIGEKRLRALYFSRATVPSGHGPHYHHIGLYAYRRQALERFVALPPGHLEQREKLEQLRALEAGMRIDIGLVDTIPLGVDTAADLERARELLSPL